MKQIKFNVQDLIIMHSAVSEYKKKYRLTENVKSLENKINKFLLDRI